MLQTKSGIPRLIVKRKADAGGGLKISNERPDCIRTVTTDTTKDSRIEANAEHVSGCSESSTAKMACKTMIATRANKIGRHFVTSSKESLQTNLEVVGGIFSEASDIKPDSRRTFISAPNASR